MADWQTKIPAPPQLLAPLTVPTKYLFGPGPSNPNMRIYKAAEMSLLGHMHADFCKVMDEAKAGLQYVFQTKNQYTLAITGTGHAAMEASIMNIVERGEPILVCDNGLWGKRAREIAERQGERYLKERYGYIPGSQKVFWNVCKIPFSNRLKVFYLHLE